MLSDSTFHLSCAVVPADKARFERIRSTIGFGMSDSEGDEVYMILHPNDIPSLISWLQTAYTEVCAIREGV